ncbi:MAG: hypothetical protein ACK4GQ_03105 [Candidatus Hadarchaeales archaeon]
MKFVASKEMNVSRRAGFSRFNVEKIRKIEDEIKSLKILKGNKRLGIAKVKVSLYGTELNGIMNYRIQRSKIELQIVCDKVSAVEKFLLIKLRENRIKLVHEVCLDFGNSLKNFLGRLILTWVIGSHLSSELDSLAWLLEGKK